jgi:hypothetical protein
MLRRYQQRDPNDFSFTPRFSEVLTARLLARSRFNGFQIGNC